VNPFSGYTFGAGEVTTPNHGPFGYSGALYVLGFVSWAAEGAGVCSIGVFRSSDAGVTWAQVGGTREIRNGADFASRSFECCRHRNDGQYLYVIYLDTGGKLAISQYDMAANAWSSDSTGPAYELVANNARWFVTMSSASDTLFVLANTTLVSTYRHVRVYEITVGVGIGGWGSGTLLGAQSPIKHYDAARMLIDDAGRVHGIVWCSEDSITSSLQQVLLRGTSGSIGSPGLSIFREAIISAGSAVINGGNAGIKLLVSYEEVHPISAVITARYSGANSSDSPSWTNGEVEPGVFGGFAQVAGHGNAELHYSFAPAFDQVLRTWDGSTLSASSPVVVGHEFCTGAREISVGGTVGLLFAEPQEADRFGTVYWQSVGSGDITGANGIPSDEAFGSTSGLRGGADQECAPASPNPPGDATGCAPGGSPGPLTQDPRQCGYQMAF